MKTVKPKKWTEVYPHGTKEGDEELKFFIALARNPKWTWRSVAALSKDTGLSKERIEEIIQKYEKQGIVIPNPKNEDQWGYWQRNLDCLPQVQPSVAKKDQDDRIKRAKRKDSADYDGL
jgi:hypothetical protein